MIFSFSGVFAEKPSGVSSAIGLLLMHSHFNTHEVLLSDTATLSNEILDGVRAGEPLPLADTEEGAQAELGGDESRQGVDEDVLPRLGLLLNLQTSQDGRHPRALFQIQFELRHGGMLP